MYLVGSAVLSSSKRSGVTTQQSPGSSASLPPAPWTARVAHSWPWWPPSPSQLGPHSGAPQLWHLASMGARSRAATDL